MIYHALRLVFGDPKYAALALVVAVLVFVFATWLPNLSLVWQIGTSSSVTLPDKIEILAGLVGSIVTNFTLFSALSLVTVSSLFGANVTLIAYGVARRRQLGRSGAATSVGGLAAGIAGVGCAACGTYLLAPMLSVAGATGLLAMLPFSGEEFSALGIGTLSLSLCLSGKMLAKPTVCLVLNENDSCRRGSSVDGPKITEV